MDLLTPLFLGYDDMEKNMMSIAIFVLLAYYHFYLM